LFLVVEVPEPLRGERIESIDHVLSPVEVMCIAAVSAHSQRDKSSNVW